MAEKQLYGVTNTSTRHALDRSFPVTGRPLSGTEFLNEFLNETSASHPPNVNCFVVTAVKCEFLKTVFFLYLCHLLRSPNFQYLELPTIRT